MATNRKKSHTRRNNFSSDALLDYVYGNDSVRERDIPLRYSTPDSDIEKTYRTHEADILSHWISQRPGSRPTLWWEHSATEPRQQVKGMSVTPGRVNLYHGVPACWAWNIQGFDPSKDKSNEWQRTLRMLQRTIFFESEASYLSRLGLLCDDERAHLTPTDFLPVSWHSVMEQHALFEPVRYKPQIETR